MMERKNKERREYPSALDISKPDRRNDAGKDRRRKPQPTPEPGDAKDDALILEALELAARQADDIGSTAMLAESVWIGRASEFRTAADRFRARSSRQAELIRVVEEEADDCDVVVGQLRTDDREPAHTSEAIAEWLEKHAAKLRSALEKE